MIIRGNWFLVKEYLKYRDEVDQVADSTLRLEKSWLYHLLYWADKQPFEKAPKIRPAYPNIY